MGVLDRSWTAWAWEICQLSGFFVCYWGKYSFGVVSGVHLLKLLTYFPFFTVSPDTRFSLRLLCKLEYPYGQFCEASCKSNFHSAAHQHQRHPDFTMGHHKASDPISIPLALGAIHLFAPAAVGFMVYYNESPKKFYTVVALCNFSVLRGLHVHGGGYVWGHE